MLIQKYIDKTVLEATIERIEFIFNSFENIIVSCSGGKDSTVLAYLALKEANKRGRKIGIYFLDEEVMYQSTIEMIEYIMGLYPENTNRLWLQIEFNLTNATSLDEGQLLCWEAGKHKEWMRPKKNDTIHFRTWGLESQTIRDKNKGFGFYDAIENFERCYSNTAFLVGLRGVESPNRWRAMVKNPAHINGQDIYWATKKENSNVAMYPLYDWNYHDIWKYIYDNELKYSKIYDFMFKKGMGLQEMRVSSLIHEKSFKAIVELPEFEPKTYNRLAKRLKGIAFAQETGRNTKMFKVQKLPKNFTSWIDYRNDLLNSYQDQSKKPIFEKRFSKQLTNEYIGRQQCRQLVLNDYENNLPIDNKPDPRESLIQYYESVL
jgi:predicted phosphoadenosine phosphosulfate sulfurtransferase